MADDDEVGVQRLEVARGVLERLAFLQRGGLGGEVDDVGGEPLLGQLEADARAGGGLDEEVDDGLAAQGRDFLDGALADGFEGARGVEHGDDFLRGERFDVEQMFAVPAHEVSRLTFISDRPLRPAPPISVRRTRTLSVERGGDILADEIRLDRQFAMAAVDQHGQLDAPGPAEIIERVHGRADGAPAEQHVIHQHTVLPVTSKGMTVGWTLGAARWSRSSRCMLTSRLPVGHRLAPDAGQQRAQALRQRHPAALDADQHHLAAGFVALGNFMRDAGQGALDGGGVQDEGGFRHGDG